MHNLKIHSEVVYLIALIVLSMSVAMLTAADFGVSMIVAPAYLLSLKTGFLTFGQSEYLIQGVMFIVFCILMKKVKPVYFSSFITCLIYGAMLDLWRIIVPIFNPNITAPGNFAMPLRIVFFIVGMTVTSFAIAMFYRSYLYPQVYDFFVKGISTHFHLKLTKFKIAFDLSMLAISVTMSLLMFGGFEGIGVGTVIMACCNGLLIGLSDKLLARFFEMPPALPRFAALFELN